MPFARSAISDDMVKPAALDGKEKMTGQVKIVKEGGAWKMGKESWSNK